MIYNYENIDTPEFFKKWKEEQKQTKKEQKEINFGKYAIQFFITFLSIIGLFTIIAIIEMI